MLIILGILVGGGLFIYRLSNAGSYMSSDPQACINCHVMIPQYATWQRSSHAHVATCADCHVPHDNIINKYQFKMRDGLKHSTIFTLRKEPQVIRISEEGAATVQQNCIHCHNRFLDEVAAIEVSYEDAMHSQGKLCWECHREIPHGTVRSLSSTPNADIGQQNSVVPQWLKNFLPVLIKSQDPQKENVHEKDL